MAIKIISAGAGSGKTYRLTEELTKLLKQNIRPSGIIATTFTNKAAAELEERVRIHLLKAGMTQQAEELANALIGTIHSIGIKLLKRFALEAGLSPLVEIITDDDQQKLFNKSLASVLQADKIQKMQQLGNKLGINKRENGDWRKPLKEIIDLARANNFSPEMLEKSKHYSFESLKAFFCERSEKTAEQWNNDLSNILTATIKKIENGADSTKITKGALNTMENILTSIKLGQPVPWYEWAKLAKLKIGSKSKEIIAELENFTHNHDAHPGFQDDVRDFIYSLFDIAAEAISEYDHFKKTRGLLDYTDMETRVDKLLDNPLVQDFFRKEIDLLLVDEFQDTSPIQLSIFYKLSELASYSIWVGDPKQSIYGFRGADPALMQAIITASGGIKSENIQIFSWRSRKDIVHATNALFTQAFSQLPPEQIYLRVQENSRPLSINAQLPEEKNLPSAIIHWHFKYEGERKQPPSDWTNKSLAFALAEWLKNPPPVYDKAAKIWRKAEPGDVAILCRTNAKGEKIAESLHQAGLQAALSRKGLLKTREIRLLVACLRLLLSKEDSLAVAEIARYASGHSLQEIIEDRLSFLKNPDNLKKLWDAGNPLVKKLIILRKQVIDLSSSEIIDLIIEKLSLKRVLLQWGEAIQRQDNLDILRQLALQYEEGSNRMHTGASLGGFLLWLQDLEKSGNDKQSAGESRDAVNILTYHKSKGLEWPVTICYDLDSPLKKNLFGSFLLSENDKPDLSNILGNRLLRYWINPYADQIKSTKLDSQLQKSEIQKEVEEMTREEEKRLLYVGMTRARDYLILPTTEKNPAKWLNRVAQQEVEDSDILNPNNDFTPWEWEGVPIPKQTSTFTFNTDFPVYEVPEKQAFFFEELQIENETPPPYRINLHKEEQFFRNLYNQPVYDIIPYHQAISEADDTPLPKLGESMNAFLIADYPTLENSLRIENASLLSDGSKITIPDWNLQLITRANAFFATYKTLTGQLPSYRKYPVSFHFENRLFETIIDFITVKKDEIFFVQQLIGTKDDSKIHKEIEKQFSLIYLTAKALQQTTGIQRVRPLLHLSLNGIFVEKPPIDQW